MYPMTFGYQVFFVFKERSTQFNTVFNVFSIAEMYFIKILQFDTVVPLA